jgi:HD-GYP domain-containing protein (c-di-GMP phosphodiesterase class II)
VALFFKIEFMANELEFTKKDFKRVVIARYGKYLGGSPASVYIKLGETKLILIIDRDDDDPMETIEKYISKGVKEVFLKKSDFEDFIARAGSRMLEGLDDTKNSVESMVETQVESVGLIHDSLKNIGMNDSTLTLVDKVSDSTLKALKKDGKVFTFIQKIMGRNDYISQLATMTSYVSMAIMGEMGIKDSNTLKKLGMASILQDSSLDNEKLAKIQGPNDEKFSDLSEFEKELVLNHTLDASKNLKGTGSYSDDFIVLLEGHHEQPNGAGFPYKLGHLKISPICCAFILAHDYSHIILTMGYNVESLNEIDKVFPDKYDKGNFRKPLACFFKIIKDL